MTEVEAPLLSKPVLASAALLMISTTIPEPGDRRAHLIREMVNLGWDDDDAVEFLALVAMPVDLLEETRRFILDAKPKSLARRRQRFFQFANDMFYRHLKEQACVAVRNGMLIAPESGAKFVPYMSERMEYLRERHGIDYTQELNDAQLLAAKGLMAVMKAQPRIGEESDDFGIIDDDALAALTIEIGERYPELVRYIDERSSLDVELLRDLMESPASAVATGVL